MIRAGYLPTISLQISGKILASDGLLVWKRGREMKALDENLRHYVVKPSQLLIHIQKKKKKRKASAIFTHPEFERIFPF